MLKLFELRADETDAEQLGLRLAIASPPGEDFRYDLSFDEYLKAAFTDEVRTHEGAEGATIKVIIPGENVELLQDATLDFTDSQGLVIRNPNRPEPPTIEGLTRDDALSAEIEALVSSEVNPALAAHGGFVTYVGHDGEGTAYMTMGGGCHGCSMSKMTMLDGVQTMLSEAIPAVQRVKDLTDHTTGENPYYS
jgi:Fe/S biogenesis protein NfuA